MNEPLPVALKPVRETHADRLFDRYLGALLGAAIADALGWITEFRKSKQELAKIGLEHVEEFTTWSKPTGGRFHTYIDYVSEGEYSDDTQLSLCTARSLQPDGNFDADRFAEELRAWLDYARGAGASVTAAARNLRNSTKVSWDSNFYRGGGRAGRRGYLDAGGNGAAMRIAAIGLANRLDSARTQEGVWRNAVSTHGHPRAIVGALTIAEAIRVLSETTHLTSKEFLHHLGDFEDKIAVPVDPRMQSWKVSWERQASRPFDGELQQVKREMKSMLRIAGDTHRPFAETLSRLGCFKPATKGSGTACVAAAVNAYLREPGDYVEGTLRIVNTLGIDTDTIASMYGSMVGVRVGSTHIPDRWSVKIQDYEYFIAEADVLAKIALRLPKENDLRVDVQMVRQRETADVLELTRARSVSKNQRVVHYLLGPGWVQSVNEQETRSGGRMLLADVVLDSGQCVRFRSFRSRTTGRPRPTQTKSARAAESPGAYQSDLFEPQQH
jgi:ADP-ribosylglycohydrolase